MGRQPWVIAAGNLKEVDLASGTVKLEIRVQDFSLHVALLYP